MEENKVEKKKIDIKDKILVVVLALFFIFVVILLLINKTYNKKIIAARIRENNSWGYSYSGRVLLEDGSIYEWYFDSENPGELFYNSARWVLKNTKKTDKKVPKEDLEQIVSLIEKVSKEAQSKKVSYGLNNDFKTLKLLTFGNDNNYLNEKLFSAMNGNVKIQKTMSRYDYSESDAGYGYYLFYDSENKIITLSDDRRQTPNRTDNENLLIKMVENYL